MENTTGNLFCSTGRLWVKTNFMIHQSNPKDTDGCQHMYTRVAWIYDHEHPVTVYLGIRPARYMGIRPTHHMGLGSTRHADIWPTRYVGMLPMQCQYIAKALRVYTTNALDGHMLRRCISMSVQRKALPTRFFLINKETSSNSRCVPSKNMVLRVLLLVNQCLSHPV